MPDSRPCAEPVTVMSLAHLALTYALVDTTPSVLSQHAGVNHFTARRTQAVHNSTKTYI